jgi:hypothetical protein
MRMRKFLRIVRLTRDVALASAAIGKVALILIDIVGKVANWDNRRYVAHPASVC